MKKKIAKVDHAQEWMLSAPVFIACLADVRARESSIREGYSADETSPEESLKKVIRDTSIAIGSMMLEAQSIGLGTCWTGWYDQEEMREVLGIPSYYYVSGILTVGYPDEVPKERVRHSLDHIIVGEI